MKREKGLPLKQPICIEPKTSLGLHIAIPLANLVVCFVFKHQNTLQELQKGIARAFEGLIALWF